MLFELPQVQADVLGDIYVAFGPEAVSPAREVFGEVGASVCECAQSRDPFGGLWVRAWVVFVGELGDDARVEFVGLGQDAFSFCEVADLPCVCHGDGQSVCVAGFDERLLVSACCLATQAHAGGVCFCFFDKRGDAGLCVLEVLRFSDLECGGEDLF